MLLAFYQALGCKIMWVHPPWPVSSESPDASPVRHRVAFSGSIRTYKAKIEKGRESCGAVDSPLYLGGAGGSSSTSTKLFKSWFCHFPAWCSLLMRLTFSIWFLAPQTWDNSTYSLPHDAVLNDKSRVRHEARHIFDTQSHPDDKYNQQPSRAGWNLSIRAGRFFFFFFSILS